MRKAINSSSGTVGSKIDTASYEKTANKIVVKSRDSQRALLLILNSSKIKVLTKDDAIAYIYKIGDIWVKWLFGS